MGLPGTLAIAAQVIYNKKFASTVAWLSVLAALELEGVLDDASLTIKSLTGNYRQRRRRLHK